LEHVGPGRRRNKASQVVIKQNPYFRIATWNATTMNKIGKLETLKAEMHEELESYCWRRKG